MATLEDYKALVQAGFERIAQEQQQVDAAVSELKAKIQELIDIPPAPPDYSTAMAELQGLVDAIPTIYEPTVIEPIVDEPTVVEPVVDEPIVDEPVVDEPVVDEPTVVDDLEDVFAEDEPGVEV